MFGYYIKRILLIVPSLLLVGLFTFYLFHAAPNDPVDDLLATEGYEEETISDALYDKQYKRLSADLKLDLPRFYFSVVPSYYPDTLHKIQTKQDRKRAVELLSYHNNWLEVSKFLDKGHRALELNKSGAGRRTAERLLYQFHPSEFDKIVSANAPPYQEEMNELRTSALAVGVEHKSSIAIPKLIWFGAENQFHFWITNFFSGKLGRSILDGRPVWSKITKALSWTMYMVILGLTISLLITIPLGVWGAYSPDSKLERFISNFFYFIYAMPLFWLGTIMVVFFTTNQYGAWTNIFPSVGIDPFRGGGSTFSNILHNSKQLILPIFCIVIHSTAYFSRLIRTSIVAESQQQYKLTAQLKGLSKRSSYWKHLFPNSLLPLLTIIVGVIPASLAGSLVLEVIFNIPGIGRLMYDSIFGNDWYVIFSIVMLVGLVTIVCYLIGDVLYSYINPKIRFDKANLST